MEAGASKEEQEQIMAAHQRDIQNLANKMEADKLRMQSHLQERLKQKREEKMHSKKKQIDANLKNNHQELEEEQQSNLAKLNNIEVCNFV